MNWLAIGLSALGLLSLAVVIFVLTLRELERDLSELDKEWWR